MWDDGAMWAGAREGQLLLRRCQACATICHPPLPMCPHCQAMTWQALVASGKARLVSWLVSQDSADTDAAKPIVIVVCLEEG
ncbi:MAG: hypothetical protein RLZZ136_1318, partial [Pseudomonadota bacterium]